MKGRHIFWLTIWWTANIVLYPYALGAMGLDATLATYAFAHFLLIVLPFGEGVGWENVGPIKYSSALYIIVIVVVLLVKAINSAADRIWS